MIAFLFFGVFASIFLDSGFGTIDVQSVSIMDIKIQLSGLIYRPKTVTADNPAPAIVLAHGISSSKEMMSEIGLELARRGFVSLCLDLLGHGKSQGTIEGGQLDPSFGVSAAVQYLKSQPFVNSSALGLVGHSLGAGAVRVAAMNDTQIGALVFIAGGLGDTAEGAQQGALNSTFPRNLLVIVGKYDVLFDLTELTEKELPSAFGTEQKVVPGVLYGNFASNTARKLVIPLTSHLFEPLDVTTVSEIVRWMEGAFGTPQGLINPNSEEFVYPQREASIAIALIGLLGLTFLLFFPIQKFVEAKLQKKNTVVEKKQLPNWRLYVVWGVINLGLFVPMFAVGLIASFPPLVFGSSVAWWLLASGLLGLLILGKFSKRILGDRIALKEELACAFTKEGAILAAVAFVVIFAVTTLLAISFNFNFRVVAPILRDFGSTSRVLVFPAFIPFFLPYFLAESLYIHKLPSEIPSRQAPLSGMLNCAVKVLAKIAPFILLLFLQYIVKIALDVWLLPSFVGFLLEFVWLIIPIFAIASSFSWWFHKRTGNALSGALFNAFLMSWIASVVFPF